MEGQDSSSRYESFLEIRLKIPRWTLCSKGSGVHDSLLRYLSGSMTIYSTGDAYERANGRKLGNTASNRNVLLLHGLRCVARN